jgi:hypothetical protein
MSAYAEKVAEVFRESDPERFGRAGHTQAEIEVERQTPTDNGLLLPQEVTPEMVALAGAAHGCGVTIHLAETRGVEGALQTWLSYTTKNKFDRFVGINLTHTLHLAWTEPIPRQPGYENEQIEYPGRVDKTKVHGAALPHRLMPARAFRNLEFARWGRLETAATEAMQLGDLNDEELSTVLKLRRETFAPVIGNAKDHIKLAGQIGAEMARQLLRNGLTPDQVSAILNTSYDVSDLEAEHGNIPELQAVRVALAQSLAGNPTTAGVEIDA